MKISKVSTVMYWLVRLTTFVECAIYVFFGISSAIGLVYYLDTENAHAVMECLLWLIASPGITLITLAIESALEEKLKCNRR